MTTLAATRAKMGSTTYYLAKMKASLLSGMVQTARDAFPDWDNLTIEERIQRELNKKRVLEEIVPYLNESEDRFFGSLIVLIDGKIDFEPISEITDTVPKAYEGIFADIGALTIANGRLIALDGQHRLVALRAIVQGEVTGTLSGKVIDDEISIVFIQSENLEKTRRIFNKVNRYARSTSRSDNLVLSEDDGAAYVARRLFMDEGSILFGETARGEDLVNWKNSTLSGRSQQFTTLSALYETVKYACKSQGLFLDEKSNSGVRPKQEFLDQGLAISREWWKIAVREITAFQIALEDPALIPQLRDPSASQSLLMKPAGQIVLFRAAHKVMSMTNGAISISEFFKRANKVNWCMESPIWDNIFVIMQSKIMTKEENQSRSANLVTYLVAANELKESGDFMGSIRAMWSEFHPNTPLPTPVH
jgi:DNA sulfur modification protein DndB